MSFYKQLKEQLDKYNDTSNLLKEIYGIDKNSNYNAIIVAPSWSPQKIFNNYNALITVLRKGPYYCSYEVSINNKIFAFINTASGASNVIDCCLTLAESNCDDVIFIGAVGALCEDIEIGDIVTPKYSIAGDGGSLYLYNNLNPKNFLNKVCPNTKCNDKILDISKKLNIPIKEKVTYCTDSIFCEYYHLDEIKKLGSELIEMETASFLRCMELIEKKGYVLLCVSDNSASGKHLVGRTKKDTMSFHEARKTNIAKIITALC